MKNFPEVKIENHGLYHLLGQKRVTVGKTNNLYWELEPVYSTKNRTVIYQPVTTTEYPGLEVTA